MSVLMMTPSDIDALIARKVMGYSPAFDKAATRPHYSTDLEAAWPLWGALPPSWRCLRYTGTTWRIEEDGPDYQDLLIVEASTAELALCLAALKAKGVDVEGAF